MDSADVVEVLEDIAVLLELKGENPFKTRAYVNGARTLETSQVSVELLVKEGRLGELKGFGEALQKKVTELVTTGKLAYYDDLKASIPAGLIEMLNIPGLGPKKIKALHTTLKIDTVDALEKACQNNEIAGIKGFGAKTQQKILDGIDFRKKYASHHRLDLALATAEPILEFLRQHPDTARCSEAGSLRRRKETLHDIDFLVSSKQAKQIIEDFTSLPYVVTIQAKGDTKASVILHGGIQADLRVVDDKSFPFALAYFTGSKEHNIIMRRRAIERGLRLNEYGLFRSNEETRDMSLCVECFTEEDIFKHLDLDYTPPELREDQGEFEAAETGKIPRLVEWGEMKGSLHNHSDWSDGRQSLEQLIEDCIELGFGYWAVTDHSKSSFQANGLQVSRLEKQIETIRNLNEKLSQENTPFRLLTGTEVDILSDGSLDFEDPVLAKLDVVVASIHQGFTQTKDQLTQRLINAAENPYVHMLGHPTGRLLLEREAYPIDHVAVIEACARTGTWIELNASPYRLDMDWRWWRLAKEKGVKCVINCDAHHLDHASFLRLGAEHARKGWLSKTDIINTLPLDALMVELVGKREKSS
ncbi:MAG: DNA polymerase/3'-5' exonuclease PolX [Verrucomicrobia bacterium]|jgi:DNA polymerase (family X)|nr:DNA polymerase/3'-5' exonuclease PolX [Verrucomicrobiota bacterium]